MQINNNIVTKILDVLSNPQEHQENEFRFGKTKNGKFSPGVSKEEFDRVFNFIKSFSKYSHTEESYTIQFEEGRKRLTLKNDTDNFFAYPWEQGVFVVDQCSVLKINKKNTDIPEYGVRFSSVKEEKCEDFALDTPVIFFKAMKRFVFLFDTFKIDLSVYKKSVSEGAFNESPVEYDIEIEVIQTISKINNTMYLIENILKAIQNTHFLMKTGEAEAVQKDYFNLVKSNRYFGVQPAALSESTFSESESYSVSLKLDGLRTMLLVFDSQVYAINSKFVVRSTGIKMPNDNYNRTVFDCEFFKETYHIFDTIVYKNNDLRSNNKFPLKKRLEFVELFIKETKNTRIVSKEHHFGNVYTLATTFAAKNSSNKDFDGMIFTPVNASYPYKKGERGVPLKWKPEELNTIDFLIKKEEMVEGSKVVRWKLYVGGPDSENVLFEVEDYPDIASISVPLELSNKFGDSTVVECQFDKTTNAFVPLKQRVDKVSPNYIDIAKDNFNLTINPYSFEKMNKSKKRDTTYFFNMRRFHNWIKRVLLDSYSVPNGSGGLLDLCCGKGGDIYKWGDNCIRYVEGYDICSKSVAEAKERYSKMAEKPIYKNMEYHFSQKDLSVDCVWSKNTFDTVSCFFAAHYFFDTEKSLMNLIKNTKNLKIGGHFILTCFDDTKLAEKDYNISNSKFKIVKKNVEPDNIYGNSIDVYLEETVLDESTTEFIVNQSNFVGVMSKRGFKLVESKLFEEYYTEWAKNSNYLNNTARLFSFLNVAMVFQKVEEYCEPITKILKREPRTVIDFCELDNYTKEELQAKKVTELFSIAQPLGFVLKKYKKAELVEYILQKQ
jgi:mRNA (guanine-N7-)-methyltransferase